jgi:predicted ester cyclase
MNPFVSVMRRYCINYVNSHDFSVLPTIMTDNYALSMGEHELQGRDSQYVNAARIQMTDISGMLLTVHDIVTNGDRLAMRFSEHGASRRNEGKIASWAGVALYHWDGQRLVHCAVEQDYRARKRQYADGVSDPVDTPAAAPWDTIAQSANPESERVVRAWLAAGMPRRAGVSFDDEWLGAAPEDVIAPQETEVLDLFSAGSRVAFHVKQSGGLAENFLAGATAGAPVFLHSAGIVEIADGEVVTGRIVRDRMGLERRLRNNVVRVA